jgi:NTE family protein
LPVLDLAGSTATYVEVSKTVKNISLALQGGGSHGAFTWGVLDRLLADHRLDIEAVTGASAGAVNAVFLAHGYAKGGREGAREALAALWSRIGTFGEYSLFRRSPLDALRNDWSLAFSPAYAVFDMVSRIASPYDLNPLGTNPLRDLLNEMIDWPAVRKSPEFSIFISATNVRTGRVKVFEQDELCAERVLASTCLPTLFPAVEIDGHAYWDGGYMGNPPLFPLFYRTKTRDIVLVQINPIQRPDVPRTAREIMNRLNEINFNASLMFELRAAEFVGRLVEKGDIDATRYRKMLIHGIDGGPTMAILGAASKINAEPDFLDHLKEIGRTAADVWLTNHFDSIGVETTLDIRSIIGN